MITFSKGIFHLQTAETSYIFKVSQFLHLQSLHYGVKITNEEIPATEERKYFELGSQVLYSQSNRTYCLDDIAQECGSLGKGDFRHSSIEIKMPNSAYICDFLYQSHQIINGTLPLEQMPTAQQNDDNCQTLLIKLKDSTQNVELCLVYTTFYNSNIITRRCYLTNNEANALYIKKLMSMQLDLPHSDYTLHTLDGSWIKERTLSSTAIGTGTYINQSITGTSSSRHNPYIMLSRNATENQGECIGINLVYSGNHYQAIDLSPAGKTRVMTGINPHCFEAEIASGNTFYTPEAVLSFSTLGFNGLSHNMHSFVKKNIIPQQFSNKVRPVLFNNWEGTYFNFNTTKLKRLARLASGLGAELFVLDDGWFGNRNSDHAGLGDYWVNRKKLRGGLQAISRYVNKKGMAFGLWFEPEMVNPNSNLFASNPHYAIGAGQNPCMGRNQLVLDLTNEEVQSYIINSVCNVLGSCKIDYVKWDMNRNLSDCVSGYFMHRYVLGLYNIVACITKRFPHILFEGCASGGNRFDLGMLRYMPQIWTSDNTDAFSRLSIQGGTSYAYPPCTMGAHVASSPSHQTLRRVPLESRFNTSAFGLLGYEFDLTMLNRIERRAIKSQIQFYKRHREVLQFGEFSRVPYANGKTVWQCRSEDGCKAVVGVFEGAVLPSEANRHLATQGLNQSDMYRVSVRQESIGLNTLGGLINFVSPVKIKGDGVVQAMLSGVYALKSEEFVVRASGALLNSGGVKLPQRFQGTGYASNVRLLGDFSSRLYVIEKEAST